MICTILCLCAYLVSLTPFNANTFKALNSQSGQCEQRSMWHFQIFFGLERRKSDCKLLKTHCCLFIDLFSKAVQSIDFQKLFLWQTVQDVNLYSDFESFVNFIDISLTSYIGSMWYLITQWLYTYILLQKVFDDFSLWMFWRSFYLPFMTNCSLWVVLCWCFDFK